MEVRKLAGITRTRVWRLSGTMALVLVEIMFRKS